jgi:hypothetical protein
MGLKLAAPASPATPARPLASRRRPVFVRDSGAFLATRPPEGATTPAASAAEPETPRVAATANLDTPDAPVRGLPARTARQDRVALAWAFGVGIGGPALALVLHALA